MNTSVKKVLITGSSGFLGKNLLSLLNGNTSYSVSALSSDPDTLRSLFKEDNIRFYHKDIIYSEIASELFRDSTVINCAYPRNSTGANIADGLKYIQKTFEVSVDNKAAAIINISSQSVYSPRRNTAAKENDALSLESSYAVGKFAVELMLESICRKGTAKFTNIRMASLIGPGFNQRIVNRFVKQAIETGRLNIKQNNQVFGFFDVEDAARGLIKMLDSDYSLWNPVYNLGTLQGYNLVTIGEEIRKVLIEEEITDTELLLSAGDETGCSVIDSQSFNKCFDYLPKISLTESIRKIAEDILKNRL